MIPVKQIIDNDVFNTAIGDLDGREFRGAVITDLKTKAEIVYEISDDFLFWVVWNEGGDHGYFCPEPMTWMINAPNLPLPGDESGYRELAPGESKSVTERIYARQPK